MSLSRGAPKYRDLKPKLSKSRLISKLRQLQDRGGRIRHRNPSPSHVPVAFVGRLRLSYMLRCPPHQTNANIRLLACLVDPDDEYDSDYRFLINGKQVKYVTTAPGTFRGDEDNRTFEPVLVNELLPPFPEGDWNSGHLVRDPKTDKPTFAKVQTAELPGVGNYWDLLKLDQLEFEEKERMKQRVRVSVHPNVNNGNPVLIKFAVWPWEIQHLEAETAAYQWLRDSDVGPEFFGHITEGKDGRVIGIITEFIKAARSAGPEDIESCRKALGELHALGVMLGDTNRHNFLVREGGGVVLIDFETAKRDCSPVELKEEMDTLEASLGSSEFDTVTVYK